MQGLETRSQETFDLFVSYAHADDADGHVSQFVELLRELRDAQHYHSWQIFFDQKAIVPGDDWQQRLARVKSAGALIVLLSPSYFLSEWCGKEWQGFREQEQKPPCLERIFPIYLHTDPSFDDSARHDDWRKDLARRQFLDLRGLWAEKSKEAQVREALTRLERTISDKLKDHAHHRHFRQLTIPYQSIPLPPYFVPRPDDLNRVRQALLSPEAGPGLVMSAVYGMGGIGKTTLAADLVRQADVRDHFEDGILWATLGQNPEVRSLLSQWIVALGDHNFRSSEAGDYQAHLRSLLQSRKMLLVIDDAWSSEHVNWFRVGGEYCRVLVTTRDAGIARAIHASAYDLDVMTPEQSLALITGRLGRALRADERTHAADLAEEVGRLPLALELIASQVEDAISWDGLREDLCQEVARLRSLDQPNARDAISEETRKNRSLNASVNLSLSRLKPPILLERFAWLGVMPDDVVVNPVMTATLWAVDERTARNELRYLRDKALLLAAPAVLIGEREHPGYRLHDVLHKAAQDLLTGAKQPEEDHQLPGLGLELPAAHDELLDRYHLRTQKGQWHTLPEDGYIHRRLGWHFEQARDEAGLHELLRQETADGRNGWFEVNDRRGEMAVFADDVARAWRLAEDGWYAPRPALGLQVRYALVTGSLNQMAGNLPPELIEALVQKGVWPPTQGFAYANRMPDSRNRFDTLRRLASFFSEAERNIVLTEALVVARQISDEYHRSWALAALASHLPEALLAEALVVARQIGDEDSRSDALVALAPHLPESLLGEALAAARQISDMHPRWNWPHPRSRVLVALALHLPEALLAEALSAAREIGKEPSRSEALAALASRLPEAQRTAVLAEALATARQFGHEYWRGKALAALARHLPESLLAEALSATRQIGNEHGRSQALAALAPHLPDGQRTAVLAEALTAAREIGDEEDRAQALIVVALHLPERQRTAVLAEALAVAGKIGNVYRHLAALAALAPHLPDTLLSEAVNAAGEFGTEYQRTAAVAALAPHLPDALLAEALAIAGKIGDEGHRVQALTALAPHLPEGQRAVVLAEAFTMAGKIGTGYRLLAALAALAPHLPEGQRTAVLEEALAVARKIESDLDRSKALAELIPHLPEGQRAAVQEEALYTAWEIYDEYYKTQAYSLCAPRLLDVQQVGALAAAVKIEDEYHRAQRLAALAPLLSGALLSEALVTALKIGDEDSRSRALSAFAPHLPESLLPEALSAARQINKEPHRSESILTIVSHMNSLSRSDQMQFWSECLRGLAAQGRSPILKAQEHFLRLLDRLTKADATVEAAEIAHAISDVGRWFP